MNKSQFIFKAVDILCEKSQNPFTYDNIFCKKDIAYSDEDEKMTCGDLYFDPVILKDGTKHPIIYNIHGGGFVMGDKCYRKSLCEYYADKGYYVYNVNHRMPPQCDITGSISDVVKGVNHIKVLAEQYNIDTNKIVVTGDSSGAFLAAYIAALRFDPALCEATGLPEVDVDIATLILHSGPYNMSKMLNQSMPLGIIPELASMLVGFEVNEDLSNIYDYDLFKYMSINELVNDNWCPTFISWSTTDFVCVDQGPGMAEVLMKHCPKVSTFYADDPMLGHCFHLMMKKKIPMQCLEKSMDFTKSILDSLKEEVTA